MQGSIVTVVAFCMSSNKLLCLLRLQMSSQRANGQII
uniref:Uncharacterized protein n=1 Tax=Arundo donax TaxID=35708 RepID=A0A0A9H5Z7_ARUDO